MIDVAINYNIQEEELDQLEYTIPRQTHKKLSICPKISWRK